MNIIKKLIISAKNGNEELNFKPQQKLDKKLALAPLSVLRGAISEAELLNRLEKRFWNNPEEVRNNIRDWADYKTKRHLVAKYIPRK